MWPETYYSLIKQGSSSRIKSQLIATLVEKTTTE